MPDPIIGVLPIQRIASLAASQIISWGMVVDSNGAQTDPSGAPQPGEVSGLPDAWTNALCDWLGFAGTGLPFAGVGKQGFAPGFDITSQATGLPSHIQAVALPLTITAGDGVSTVTSGFDQATATSGIPYVASGVNAGGAGGEQRVMCQTITPNTDHHYPFSLNQQLKLVMRYATFASGSGSQFWRPSIRQAGSLTWYGGASGNVSTVTGTNSIATYELDIPSGSGRQGWQAEASRLLTDSLVGPFALISSQLVDPNVTTGVCVSGLNYQGGLGGVEAAASVLAASDTALAELLYAHVLPQIRLGQTPAYVIQWMHGGNDRNDSGQASYNPATNVRNGADSSTATGVYNNCLTYYRRILDIWTRVLGYSADRLFLIAGPYMEQAAYVSTLAGYETALGGINTLYPRAASVLRGTVIFNANVMDDMDWNKDESGEDGDDAHKIRQGYFAWAYIATAALRAAAISGVNALTPTDLSLIVSSINADTTQTTARTNAATASTNTATLLTRVSGNLTISGGKVAATVASGDDADAASIKSTIGTAGAGLTALAPASTALSTAVWTGTKAGYLDAAISSRMATFTYTTPPTAAQNASAVRSELTTELGRIDVATSTRGTYSGGNITGNLSGSVGSVTGNVGGNVVGSVASVTNGVTLAATQSLYAPAKAGDAMTLTSDYDAAKTAASATTADAIKAKTDNLPASPASTADVQPTINFNPTINPTTLDSGERTQIAASVAANAVIQQIAADAAAGAEGGLDANTIANAVWAYVRRTITDGPIRCSLQTQVYNIEIMQGDSYGPNGRQLPVMASDGGDWPEDASVFTWHCFFAPVELNGSIGELAYTADVTVLQATGDSQGLRIDIPSEDSASLTAGKYAYVVTGVGDGQVRSVQRGMATVIPHP